MPPFLPPPDPEEQTAIRRAVIKAKLPLVSGSGSVVVLVLCFVLSADAVFLVGWTVHWPLWVDFEIMLLLWWLVWIVTLGRLLYLGVHVSDEPALRGVQPRNWLWSGGDGGWGGDVGVVDAGEGCVYVVGMVMAAVAVLLVAWVFVEIVIPLLSIILYGLIRGMLARSVNDDHGCA